MKIFLMKSCWKSIFRIACILLVSIFLVLTLAILATFLYHKNKLALVDKEWKERETSGAISIGSTKTLSILPLVNWHAAGPKFKTEMGVSYLVKTDDHTILFDLGQNLLDESPSPLVFNMMALGIRLSDIDTLFLSHSHFDHVGGKKWEKQKSFSLDSKQTNLKGKEIYASEDLIYPDAIVQKIKKPTRLYPGVASLGPIPRKLFIGRIDEQALVVNVENKGLVIISGCGHQTLPKIILRAKESFKEPIYGIVGDLHYPVPNGRLQILGLNAQQLFASGTDPLNGISEEDINSEINMLKELELGAVALGGHDSSDEVISKFAGIFGEKFHRVLVGKWIEIAPSFKTK